MLPAKSRIHRRLQRCCFAGLVCGLASGVAGCGDLPPAFGGGAPPPEPTPAPSLSDNPFTLTARSNDDRAAGLIDPARRRTEIRMHVMLVQVPRDERSRVEKVWNHLREDVIDATTMLRLRRNGLRAGVGRLEWWEPIQVGLNAIDGARAHPWEPLRMPPGYALGVEMDSVPREQTIFCVQDDGILSGGTFPQSQNVLQMTCLLDARERRRVHLMVVPEVRQQLNEMQWVKTEAGYMEVPKFDGQRFTAAALTVALDAGEFVLLAPSQEAGLFGIVGGALLTGEVQNRRYDSYVFLRPEIIDAVAGN